MVPILELAVLEQGGGIARLLRPLTIRNRFRLVPAAPGAVLRCGLLVVSPTWHCDGKVVDAVCRILLTPTGTAGLFRRLETDWVVSFGPSPQDSVSFSSLEPGALMLSVRREVPTLSGGLLDMQDIPVRCPEGAVPEEALAAGAAVLLALGQLPCINRGPRE